MTTKKTANPEHFARANSFNVPISTKQSIEISKSLRYKRTNYAISFLEEVIGLRKAVPFKTFNRDMGHKAGMSSGRFPQKAAKEFLRLVKSVEANAQFKGLNTSNLKITKLVANKGVVPITGGRHRRATKRTNLEIEVKEVAGKKTEEKKKKEAKVVKKEEKNVPVTETKVEEKVAEVKDAVETKEVEKKKEAVVEETNNQDNQNEIKEQPVEEEKKE